MKKKLTSMLAAAALVVNMAPVVPFAQTTAHAATTQRAMENLGRGLVVIKNGNNMQLSWRLLGTESYDTSFNIYRDGYIIANVTDSTFYLDGRGDGESLYQIAPVVNGVEGEKCAAAKQWNSDTNYLEFEIPVPTGGDGGALIHDGEIYTYELNDMSTGDLDGDGEYELVVKFMPSNAGESTAGPTGNVMLGAYELDGTPLWTDNSGNTLYIDLGLNIRANPHGPQFLVYDFNSDGIAEIATKTAQGTMDTQGNVLVESSTGPDYYTVGKVSDYSTDTLYNKSTSNPFSRVNSSGTVLSGREYYTMYNGYTGAFIDTVAYHTPRTFKHYDTYTDDTKKELTFLWGDGWGNRVDRHSDTVAYLDGETPYAVEWRGYYHGTNDSKGYNGTNLGRTAVGAYKLVGNDLQCAYTFDTAGDVLEKYENEELLWNDIFKDYNTAVEQLINQNPDWNYCGNGNHNMVAADFDEDGMDEVASGSLCLQLKDGKFGVKWNYNRGHGDAFSVGRYVKDGPMLYFIVHEDGRAYTEVVHSNVTTDLDTSIKAESKDKEKEIVDQTVLERNGTNDVIKLQFVTTKTTIEGQTINTKIVTRTYSDSTLTANGRGYGMSVIDPRADGETEDPVTGVTGEPVVLFHEDAGGDTGRGLMIKGCADYFSIDSTGNTSRKVTYDPNAEDDSDDSDGVVVKNHYVFTTGNTDEPTGGKSGGYMLNSKIYWDGDVYEEALDGMYSDDRGPGIIIMADYNNGWGRYINFDGTWSNNASKNNVCLSADLIGDWREEFVCRTDNGKVRLYTTNVETDEKIYTLMHDSQYRSGVASEQAAYNQPPQVSWYMGEDMDMAADKPNITAVEKTVDVTPVSTSIPSRTYEAGTAATLLWQDNTEQTSTADKNYVGHVLETKYTGTFNVHASVYLDGAAYFQLRDSNSNKIDGNSYQYMINEIKFEPDGTIFFNKNSWNSGVYTAGKWYDIDISVDLDKRTQTIVISDAITGTVVAEETVGIRQDNAIDFSRISFVSGDSIKTVAIKNCAVYTGDAPTKSTVTAKRNIKAGETLAVSTSFATIGGTAPTSWVSGENMVYTLYKDNVYTPVEGASVTATADGVLIDRNTPIGEYILGIYDGVSAFAYTTINVINGEPIKVTDNDIVLEVNGLSGTSIAGTVYSDTDLTQSVSKSDLGIERKSNVLSVLAKISDSCEVYPEYTVDSYKVIISQDGKEVATVTPTVFASNNNICMSQFVDGAIAPGEYSVTVEMTVVQDNDTYTVSKTGTVTIKQAANIEEYFYTVNGINVTVFVK